MAGAVQSPRITRLSGVLGFFIGIFGAMAILGVFFKILKLPHYEIFMIIGFVGEAAAFVVMGFMSLVSSFTAKKYEAFESAEHASVQVRPDEEVRDAVREMLTQRVSSDVDKMMHALSREVGRFGTEIQQVGSELERARHAIFNMRQELDRVASGDLAGDAERLGRGMQVLGSEMGEAGEAVERMRSDLEDMARRFRYFNEPQPHEPAKIKKMPWS